MDTSKSSVAATPLYAVAHGFFKGMAVVSPSKIQPTESMRAGWSDAVGRHGRVVPRGGRARRDRAGARAVCPQAQVFAHRTGRRNWFRAERLRVRRIVPD